MPTNYGAAIDELAEEINQITESKGFHDVDLSGDFGLIIAKIALIATEVSELLDVYRAKYDDSAEDTVTCMTILQEDDFMGEAADIVIRTFDLMAFLDLDFGNAVIEKIEKNRERPYKHGKRF